MEFELNKDRISREALYIRIAWLISLRGTCSRLQVGAVAVRDGRIVATGYNGSLPAEPHCHPSICDASKPCEHAVHAEANLIAYAAKEGISLDECELYCTHQPCIKCAELIIAVGINKVYYLNSYRLLDGLHRLNNNHIETTKINEQGITQQI